MRQWILGCALTLALVTVTAGLPVSGAGFVTTTSNGSSSWTAASSFAATPSGTLWGWGNNAANQLGDGTTTSPKNPKLLDSTATWNSVGAGKDFTCATRTDGHLYCMGSNASGATGLGTTTGSTTSITRVGTATDWNFVSAGELHACAIKTTGTLWCWGSHLNGRLGLGTLAADVTSPTQVGTATTWANVNAGEKHTCAVRTDSTLYCWGGNTSGQVGDGTSGTDRLTPVQISSGDGGVWSKVGAGSAHTCATRTDKTLYCWGADGSGQLGNGSGGAQTAPQQIATADGGVWADLSVGSVHNCAAKTGGTAWCWGSNASGRLGVGVTGGSYHSPTEVSGSVTTWATVAVGFTYSCAVRTDASMWCWGSNSVGQLGVGTTTSHNTPQRVINSSTTGLNGDVMFSGAISTTTFALDVRT